MLVAAFFKNYEINTCEICDFTRNFENAGKNAWFYLKIGYES